MSLDDLSPELIFQLLVLLGVAKLLELGWNKLLNRKTNQLTDRQIQLVNTKSEIEIVRAVLEEVQEHSATKDGVIDDLKTQVGSLSRRVERVEAREHQANQLTAAHEEWDLRILRQVLEDHPEWPSPPPLRAPLPIEAFIDTETRETYHEEETPGDGHY